MAETNALLKRRTGNRTEGSNPSVSATYAANPLIRFTFWRPSAYRPTIRPTIDFALLLRGEPKMLVRKGGETIWQQPI